MHYSPLEVADMTNAQQRTYDELRGDYEYAEVFLFPNGRGTVMVELFDKRTDAQPANTVEIEQDGTWS